MSVTVRALQDADLETVTALYGREVREGVATFEDVAPTRRIMAERLSAVRAHGLPWVVAEADGRVVGWAYASPFRPRSAYRYSVESSVYVAQDFQGQGVGTLLMKAVIDRCRGMGMRQMIAAISNDRSAGSVTLHARLGFRTVGVYRRVGYKFGRWLDVTLMQLDLEPDGGDPAGPGLTLG